MPSQPGPGDLLPGLSNPIIGLAAVTPADGANLPLAPTRGLWVGGGGAVSVDTLDGDAAVVIAGVPAGTMLPIRVVRVRATGTTATLILACY